MDGGGGVEEGGVKVVVGDAVRTRYMLPRLIILRCSVAQVI